MSNGPRLEFTIHAPPMESVLEMPGCPESISDAFAQMRLAGFEPLTIIAHRILLDGKLTPVVEIHAATYGESPWHMHVSAKTDLGDSISWARLAEMFDELAAGCAQRAFGG